MTSARQVSQFEALRPHLMAVAYRLTGTVADAEDIVQDAWLRWDSAGGRDTIADLRAWLTTVVSRLGLDRLRSAAHRRETYTGNWLPEPVVTGFDDADPLSVVVANEAARSHSGPVTPAGHGTSGGAGRRSSLRGRSGVDAGTVWSTSEFFTAFFPTSRL